MTQKIFITGASGFIGFHLAQKLAQAGYDVLGLDNLNDYYDVSLKQARLKNLENFKNFKFIKADCKDKNFIEDFFKHEKPEIVIHLAAQAGVRYSLESPQTYIDSNITGFLNMLEGTKNFMPRHFIYASSSSVYGGNTKVPFAESDDVLQPKSLYAVTKRSNELMAESYAHLYKIPLTGLRFFTVYGAWGRPDMAYFKFTDAILRGKKIDVYNFGNMMRDFTYIDDIIEGVEKLIPHAPQHHEIYNIGNNKPEKLMDMISSLENLLGKKAEINFLDMQAGDVVQTYASIEKLHAKTGFMPQTKLEEGLAHFTTWFKRYYGF